MYERSDMGAFVRAASGIPAGSPGTWWSRKITPGGEMLKEVPVSRNYAYPIGGGPLHNVRLHYSHEIKPMGAFGQDDMIEKEETPTSNQLTTVDDPISAPSKKELAMLSDQDLTDRLNESISRGWRLKMCHGPYCTIQAERNRSVRVAMLAEYRRRQMDRVMPPLKEPVHTLAYGRYKLSKTVLNWADTTLTGRMLWPVKIYLKSAAHALEDVVGSEYLSAFIVSSPFFGVWAIRKLGYRGVGWAITGAYFGMLAGAMLPMSLFALSKFIGAAEEKDFLWAVS